jgi:hypothetical protein
VQDAHGLAALAANRDPASAIRAAPRLGSLRPDDLVWCEPFACLLMARRCVERQRALVPSGHAAGTFEYRECQGCPDGAAIAARFPTYVAPPFVLYDVARCARELAAAKRRRRVGLEGDVLMIDATMAPQDRRGLAAW